MTGGYEVKRNAIVAAAVVALGAVGLWFLYPREVEKGNSATPTSANATREAGSGGSKGDSASPVAAMAICRKLAEAGIAGSCEASSNPSHAPFDGVAFSIPQGASGGMVVHAHDAATYGLLEQNINGGFILHFDGPRVIVQVDKETPPDVRAKIKPLVDSLFSP
jgi:hypothetical protein